MSGMKNIFDQAEFAFAAYSTLSPNMAFDDYVEVYVTMVKVYHSLKQKILQILTP